MVTVEPSDARNTGGRSSASPGPALNFGLPTGWNTSRIAPLEDEEMLEAVQRGLAEIVIPELRRRGANDFVVSQTHSLMSMVSFVRRGLPRRQLARAFCEEELAGLESRPTDDAATRYPGKERDRILRRRLEADIAGRCEP